MANALRISSSGTALIVGGNLPPRSFTLAVSTSIEVSISVISQPNTPVNPATFYLEATVTGIPTEDVAAPVGGQDETKILPDFYWDADNVGATFSSPQRAMRDITNANNGIGPLFAPCYTTAGSYEPSVTVYVWSQSEGALLTNSATVDSPLVVADRDSTYTQVAFIDPDGDYTGSPATGGLNYTSLTAAANAVADLNNGNPTQFLIRGGKTLTLTSGYNWDSRLGHVYIGRHGTGTTTIDGSGVGSANDASLFFFTEYDSGLTKDFIIDQIRFEGGWNEILETGFKRFGFLSGAGSSIPNYMLVNRCVVNGFGNFLSHAPGSTATSNVSLHIHDTIFSSKSDFTVLFAHEFFSMTGCRDIRDPEARGGGPRGASSVNNSHSGTRGIANRCLFSKNDCGNWSGWVTAGAATYLGNTLFVPNTSLRLNTEPQIGALYSVVENILEGGDEIMHFASSNGIQFNPMSSLIDSNVFISIWSTIRAIATAFTCSRISNNFWFIPNIDLTGGGAISGVSTPRHFVGRDFAADSVPSTPQNDAGRLFIVNNSIINFSTNALTAEIDSLLLSFLPNITVDRNLFHQPTAGGTDWDLDFSSMFEAAKTENVRYSIQGDPRGDPPLIVPLSATPAGSVQLPTPGVSSNARNAHATGGLYTVFDFNRNSRSLPDWTGAIASA